MRMREKIKEDLSDWIRIEFEMNDIMRFLSNMREF